MHKNIICDSHITYFSIIILVLTYMTKGSYSSKLSCLMLFYHNKSKASMARTTQDWFWECGTRLTVNLLICGLFFFFVTGSHALFLLPGYMRWDNKGLRNITFREIVSGCSFWTLLPVWLHMLHLDSKSSVNSELPHGQEESPENTISPQSNMWVWLWQLISWPLALYHNTHRRMVVTMSSHAVQLNELPLR